MDKQLLREIGLNDLQAKAYITLIKNGPTAPANLAHIIGTTRPNAYSVLEKLTSLGLIRKVTGSKKALYRAENPIALEQMAASQRTQALEHEKRVKDSLPTLLNFFYTYSEQPGIRFFQGREGIREIYLDQVRTSKPIYLIRTSRDIDFFGFEFMHEIRNLARKHKISRHAITPDSSEAPRNWRESDAKMLLTRTWVKGDSYTAPVEWSVYGDKVSVISFGEEAIGMIIASPQIAESVRQLYAILDKGLRADPEYHTLPRHARYEAP